MKKIFVLASMLVLGFSCQNEDATVEKETTTKDLSKIAERGCDSHNMLEYQLKQDPSLAQRMKDIEVETSKFISEGKIVNGVLEIPVVFNVLYTNSTNNISDAQIQSQIDVLNNDFRATNSDYNSSNPFNSVRGGLNVKFILDAINRKSTTTSIWYSVDNFMKSTSKGGISPTSPTTKLNFWVVPDLRRKDTNSQLLGFGQFPGGSSATDGIVCGHYCTGVGGSTSAPFNLGRTATHEVGHWMNLRHIWGDTTCGSDSVSDTPTHNDANYGVPATGHKSTCTGTPLEMYMNYMDYTDDRGMYMFSSGQVSRMAAIFSSTGSRRSFR
ncbi:MAG: zinc metalloprotease [Flavobacterium sp.]|nr:zinc metalloprotease [Flavobacterium sp.]